MTNQLFIFAFNLVTFVELLLLTTSHMIKNVSRTKNFDQIFKGGFGIIFFEKGLVW